MADRIGRREDIFWEDEDRSLWIANFAEMCQQFHWRCHAYCLMSNYYHIVVETPEGNLDSTAFHPGYPAAMILKTCVHCTKKGPP